MSKPYYTIWSDWLRQLKVLLKIWAGTDQIQQVGFIIDKLSRERELHLYMYFPWERGRLVRMYFSWERGRLVRTQASSPAKRDWKQANRIYQAAQSAGKDTR
jgi:hypothetical protein